MAGDFDLHQLLAGPIIAMNDAQSEAAGSFYEIFDQFAFEPTVEEAAGEAAPPRRLRMISFVAERSTPEGIERRQISMPLLQMIPIAGVTIDSAKIEFSLAVNAEPAAAARPAAGTAAVGAGRTVALKGQIAPTSGADRASTGNLQVEIVLKQADLPAGYINMIAETQGGMSRLVDEPAPGGGTDPKPEETPLFTASIMQPQPLMGPGGEYELSLMIGPIEKWLGPDGLDITFLSWPRRAMRIVTPTEPVRFDRRARPQKVRIRVAESALDKNPVDIALVVEGEALGPDGVFRKSSVRFILFSPFRQHR
jgi:hypothetical protein